MQDIVYHKMNNFLKNTTLRTYNFHLSGRERLPKDRWILHTRVTSSIHQLISTTKNKKNQILNLVGISTFISITSKMQEVHKIHHRNEWTEHLIIQFKKVRIISRVGKWTMMKIRFNSKDLQMLSDFLVFSKIKSSFLKPFID